MKKEEEGQKEKVNFTIEERSTSSTTITTIARTSVRRVRPNLAAFVLYSADIHARVSFVFEVALFQQANHICCT